MPDNVINIIVNGKNNASPALKQVSADTQGIINTITASGSKMAATNKALSDSWREAVQDWEKASSTGGKLSGTISTLGSVLSALMSGPALAVSAFGIGLITALQAVSAEMDKTIASIEKFSTSIENDLTNAINTIAINQAKAANDISGVIELTAQKELDSAEQKKNEKIKKAQEELDAVSGMLVEFTGQRLAAEAQYRAASLAAEAEFANQTLVIHSDKVTKLAQEEAKRKDFLRDIQKSAQEAEAETVLATMEANNQILAALDRRVEFAKNALDSELTQTLEKIEKELGATAEGLEARRLAEEEFQNKVVQLEQEASDKRVEILKNLTDQGIRIFKSLGEEFSEVVQQLEVASFVQQASDAMKTLEQMFNAGVISLETYTQGTEALSQKMQEAISLGYVPTIEKTKELQQVTQEAAATQKSAAEVWLDSMTGISSAIDAVIAKTRQLGQEAASAASAVNSATGGGSSGGSGGGIKYDASGHPLDAQGQPFISIDREDLEGPPGSGLTPFNPAYNLTPPSQTSPSGSGGGGMGSVDPSQTGQSVFGSDDYYTNLRYKHGGVVPGRRVRRARHGLSLDGSEIPVLAHPGEIIDQPRRIVDHLADAVRRVDRSRGGAPVGSGGGQVVNNYNVSVNQQGTVIQQERDWASLVENLAQSMGTR